MKAIPFILTILTCLSARSQFYLPIEENQLFKGGIPTNAAFVKYSDNQISSAFRYLTDTLNFEYRYVYGACEVRAHFMSLALKSKGIVPKKVWCFAPARYSFFSHKQLSIKDPLGITTQVPWTYHVAPVVVDSIGDTLVIDPSFSTAGPLKLRTWLSGLNCPEAIFNFSDANWLSFNSLNKFHAYNNVDDSKPRDLILPKWFQDVMTGNFYFYDTTTNQIPTGLAVNDIAVEMYTKERNNLSVADFTTIFGNINNIIAFLTNTTNNMITAEFKDNHKDLIEKYETRFKERFDYWSRILSALPQQ